MELSNSIHLCEANVKVTRHLDRIVLRAGSTKSKWLVIRSLYEKIAYFANRTRPFLWYLELDKVVPKSLSRVSKNMHKVNGNMGFYRL